MLGIPDPWIWGAYVLSFLTTTLCIVYSVISWNKGGVEELSSEDKEWIREEIEIEETV